jgi:hypothetical protein
LSFFERQMLYFIGALVACKLSKSPDNLNHPPSSSRESSVAAPAKTKTQRGNAGSLLRDRGAGHEY